ncbi:hypothetical protein IC235_15900 [Hymenobacter sp. BT664]|uniref:DUF4145 domain-containing protein n=1 Tax=Hymenobacter montanus TaxID=2771359 RepID=A0A927BEI8_9BACT|nr:hypothetical protein [Hymenobacter montanus]MBD2769372.1 hypothetical protein [Hymenobacter montanus]
MNQPTAGDWYEPDSTWRLLGFDTRESYVAHMVAPAQFHPEVHEDVVKSYRTVEHLMALAWYHYPMYDEAIKKLTSMVEMAVKLRCQQKGIPIAEGQNDSKNRPLARLIDELCTQLQSAELKQRLHAVRGIRNRQAHPEHHSFGGIAMSIAVEPLVYTLNLLFLAPEANHKEA